MTQPSLLVCGLGGCTSLGATMRMSAAVVGCQMSKVKVYDYGPGGATFIGATVPMLPAAVRVPEHLSLLTDYALDDVYGSIPRSLTREKISLVLGVPASEDGAPVDVLPAHPGFALKARFTAGHAGFFRALRRMQDRPSSLVVIAMVDSLLRHASLNRLNAERRAATTENSAGLVAGEGAGACLFATQEMVKEHQLPVLGVIHSVGVAKEVNLPGGENPNMAEGITEAWRQALAGVPQTTRIGKTYIDLNGEAQRADEFSFATIRHGSRFVQPGAHIGPACYWGDVGAASGPLLLGLALTEKGSPDQSMLISTSSDDGERGAAVVTQR